MHKVCALGPLVYVYGGKDTCLNHISEAVLAYVAILTVGTSENKRWGFLLTAYVMLSTASSCLQKKYNLKNSWFSIPSLNLTLSYIYSDMSNLMIMDDPRDVFKFILMVNIVEMLC